MECSFTWVCPHSKAYRLVHFHIHNTGLMVFFIKAAQSKTDEFVFMLFVFIALQFFDRIKLFGMPAKHQPDLIYLRYVPLWKVHIFTIVQLTCLVLLWVIKATAAAVVFPMMVNIKSHPLIGSL